MILRNRLKERRAALNVNQQEMGRLCGVSRQTISLIERGDYSPSVTLALTIAKVCGVTVEEVAKCASFMVKDEDLAHYPYTVTEEMIVEAARKLDY